MQNVDNESRIDSSSTIISSPSNLDSMQFNSSSSTKSVNSSRSRLISSDDFDSWSNVTRSTLSSTTSSYDTATLNFYFSVETKMAVLPILLMVAGTLGNCLAFYVLTRKRLRNQSTMLYFATLTLMDTLALYQWCATISNLFSKRASFTTI